MKYSFSFFILMWLLAQNSFSENQRRAFEPSNSSWNKHEYEKLPATTVAKDLDKHSKNVVQSNEQMESSKSSEIIEGIMVEETGAENTNTMGEVELEDNKVILNDSIMQTNPIVPPTSIPSLDSALQDDKQIESMVDLTPKKGLGDTDASYLSSWNSCLEFLYGHLEVGIRVMSFDLEETSRPEDLSRKETFLGYINQLKSDQDSSPKLFLNLLLNKYIGIGIAYDEVAVSAISFNTGFSDGVLEMSGPIFSIIGRYSFENVPIFGADNDYRIDIIPFVELGYADWDTNFKEEDWWAAGFGSHKEWTAEGSPSPLESGIQREIHVMGDSSTVITGGLSFIFNEHFGIDIIYRQMDLHADAQFLRGPPLYPSVQNVGIFPMSHSATGIGVKIIF